MPTCRMIDSMPKVRPSSGMMGTISLPIFGSFISCRNMLTKPMVVETARPSSRPATPRIRVSGGALKLGRRDLSRRHESTQFLAALARSKRSRDCRRADDRATLRARLLRNRNLKARAERGQRLVGQLLFLMGGVAGLGRAQAVALDRVRQNHGRAARDVRPRACRRCRPFADRGRRG